MTAEIFLRWVVAVLSLVGLALATYLSVAHVTGTGPACSVGGGCHDVTGSDYSVLLGVPVAFLGVAGYSALLLGNLAYLGLNNPPNSLMYGLLGTALIGEVFSSYFTFTQAFLIHSYCIYCLTSATITTAILVTTIVATVLSLRTGEIQAQRF